MCCATSAETRIITTGSTRGELCWWSTSVSTAAMVMVHMAPNIRQSSWHELAQVGANTGVADSSEALKALLVEAGVESVTIVYT